MNNYTCECGALYKTAGTALYCEFGAFEIFWRSENILPAKIHWVSGGFCNRCAILAAQHVVMNGYEENGIYYTANKAGFFAATCNGAIAAITPFERVKIVGVNRWKVAENILNPAITDFSSIRIQDGGREVMPEDWDRFGVGGKFAAALLYKQTGRLYTDLPTVRRLLAVQGRDVDRVHHALYEGEEGIAVWMRHLRVMLVEDGKENQLYTASDMR